MQYAVIYRWQGMRENVILFATEPAAVAESLRLQAVGMADLASIETAAVEVESTGSGLV